MSDMSKDFAEARARGEAANEIDALHTALAAANEDLTAARAMLREALPFVGGVPYTDEAMGRLNAIRARIKAMIGGER